MSSVRFKSTAAARLARYAASAPSEPSSALPSRRAAVLVPLFLGPDNTLRVLLTKRAATLSSHAGEVSLPGGMAEEADSDDAATAIREAHEEVGLPPARVTVLATLPAAIGKRGLPVRPVVARIPDDFEPLPSSAEVDFAFSVPLSRFLSAAGHSCTDIVYDDAAGAGDGASAEAPLSRADAKGVRSGTNTGATGASTGAPTGASTRAPIRTSLRPIRVHFFECDRAPVWGLTAHFLIQVAKIVFSREPDFEERPPGAPPRTGEVPLTSAVAIRRQQQSRL